MVNTRHDTIESIDTLKILIPEFEMIFVCGLTNYLKLTN